MNTMNGHQHVGQKRREPDDLVQDLLNVSLSPPKKLRASVPGEPFSSGLGANFATTPVPVSPTPWGFLSGFSTGPTSLPPTTILTSQPVRVEEKALVLYRPVTPPLFPGGPPAGSVDFPYKVNSAMLPKPQGTDSELTSHQLDCQSACSNDTDTPSGHGLFQALDLSGGPVSFTGQRRLNRTSSCSSLPRFSVDNEDQLMAEEGDKSAELAVIPWVPMTPLVAPPKIRPIVEDIDDESVDMPDDVMVDEDSMDVVDEEHVTVSETSGTPITGQFGSPLPSFNAGPWQAEILQPPFTTAMWSH